MSAAVQEPVALPSLFDDERRVHVVPIRHHSPACARHLLRLIDDVSPALLLVEGPCDFDPMLRLLADEATRPPVAIVSLPARAKDEDAERVVHYFPFCEYSPEWVAIRSGAERGIEVRFIDLPSHDRRADGIDEAGDEAGMPRNLLDERALDLNTFTQGLAQRLGCRDQNELWDHLFESRADGLETRAFFDEVGAYCAHVRATIPDETLETDGTLAREAHMRACLQEAMAEVEGPIVVVVGGLHAPPLVEARDGGTPARGARKSRSTKAPENAYLVRYGFRQLDRLSGYSAGMPSPAYYQRVWQHGPGAGRPTPWRELSADLLLEFAAHVRAEHPGLAFPLPALSAALESAASLADLRGRAGPTREDLLDACRSSFMKGEESGDGAPVLQALLGFLGGSAIGDIPPSAGSPPLVEDARARARSLRFRIDDGDTRERRLDLHRRDTHREASRFLHALQLLDAGFARRTGGPDFLSGVDLDRLFETWTVAWSPLVEARLIERSADGDRVETAAATELMRRLRALEEDGRANDAHAAIGLLVVAFQAGLSRQAAPLLPLVEAAIGVDPRLASVTRGLASLVRIRQGEGILGVEDPKPIERLIALAYRRALGLVIDLESVPDERLDETLGSLADLRELVLTAADGDPAIDPDGLREALESLRRRSLPPTLDGAIEALSFLTGLCEAAHLSSRLTGELGAAYQEDEDKVAFLRGVIAVGRELLWRVPVLLDEMNQILVRIDEERFIALLPHLRLALAALDPRETDRLAGLVADRLHVRPDALAADVVYGADDAEVQANLALALRVAESLRADGLAEFLGEGARSGPGGEDS